MPGGYSTDYLRNLTVWGKTADQHKKIGGSISVRMDWDRVVSVQKGTVDFQTVSERKKKKEKKKKKKRKRSHFVVTAKWSIVIVSAGLTRK